MRDHLSVTQPTRDPPATGLAAPRRAAAPLSPIAFALTTVAALGAGGGFVLGSLILGLLQRNAPGGYAWVDIPFSMTFGGTFGAVLGAIGAPLTGWLLFRHVPLGRAMAATAVGTLVGAAIGNALDRGPVMGGCLGFVAAGLLLRLTYSRLTWR